MPADNFNHVIDFSPQGCEHMRQQLFTRIYASHGYSLQDLGSCTLGDMVASLVGQSKFAQLQKLPPNNSGYRYDKPLMRSLPEAFQGCSVGEANPYTILVDNLVNDLTTLPTSVSVNQYNNHTRHGTAAYRQCETQHFNKMVDWMAAALKDKAIKRPAPAISPARPKRLRPVSAADIYSDDGGELKEALCKGLGVDPTAYEASFRELLTAVVKESHVPLAYQTDLEQRSSKGKHLGFEVYKRMHPEKKGRACAAPGMNLTWEIIFACGACEIRSAGKGGRESQRITEDVAYHIGTILYERGVKLAPGEKGPVVTKGAHKPRRDTTSGVEVTIPQAAEALSPPIPATLVAEPVAITQAGNAIITPDEAAPPSERTLLLKRVPARELAAAQAIPQQCLQFLKAQGVDHLVGVEGEKKPVIHTLQIIPDDSAPGMFLMQAHFRGTDGPLPPQLAAALDAYEKLLPGAACATHAF